MQKARVKQVTIDDESRLRLIKAKEILDQHSLFDPLTTKQLSCQVFFQPRTLSKKFLLLFGVTPAAYLLERRMLTAAQLLKDNKETIFSVGVMLGYQHTSSFSFAFKKRFGMGPKEWRNRLHYF